MARSRRLCNVHVKVLDVANDASHATDACKINAFMNFLIYYLKISNIYQFCYIYWANLLIVALDGDPPLMFLGPP
jgi:hypothetical protein